MASSLFGGNRNAMNFNDLANQVGRVNDMMQTQFNHVVQICNLHRRPV